MRFIPPRPVINWKNPLTRGLRFDSQLFQRQTNQALDLVSGAKGTFTDTTFQTTKWGYGRRFNGSGTTKLDFLGVPTLAPFSYITVEIAYRMTGGGSANYGELFRLFDNANATRWFAALNDNYSGGWGLRIDTFYTNRERVYSIGYPTLNAAEHLVIVYDHSSTSAPAPTVYRNGVKQSVTLRFDQAWTKTINASDFRMFPGWAGEGAYCRVWNRMLSQAEAQALYANPARIYRDPLTELLSAGVKGINKVLLSEVGSGSDTLSLISRIGLTDTGVGADAPALLGKIPVADVASGAEALAVINKALISESGIGAELLLVLAQISVADSGLGAEILSILAKVALADAAAGSEVVSVASTFLQKSVSDAGTGAEAITLLARIAQSDTGLAQDACTILSKLALADTAAGAEVLQVLAKLALQDAGTALDTVFLAGRVLVLDSASASEVLNVLSRVNLQDAGVAAELANVTVRILAGESGAGSDALAIVRRILASDTGTGVDTLRVLVTLMVAEAGLAAEALAILNHLKVTDSALGADVVNAINALIEYTARNLYSGRKSFSRRDLYRR